MKLKLLTAGKHWKPISGNGMKSTQPINLSRCTIGHLTGLTLSGQWPKLGRWGFAELNIIPAALSGFPEGCARYE
jgi:hypothetical protein